MRLEVVSHIPDALTHQTPILFLHGEWHAAWCWEDFFLPYFAEHGFSAHAMSLRGHGLSEGRNWLRWVSIEDYVTDLVEVVRSLPQPPVIVGHSLGGFITQKYLEDYDAPAVVLLAPAPAQGGWKFTRRIIKAMPGAFVRSSITFSPYALINTVERAQAVFFSSGMPRDQVERHFARIQDDSFRAYLDYLMFALANTNRIRERGTRMLILGGADDRIFPVADQETLATLFDADLTILPDTAHDIMLEAGWQAAADRIIGWLGEKGVE